MTSAEEISVFVDFTKNQAEPEYNETVTAAKPSDKKDGDPESATVSM